MVHRKVYTEDVLQAQSLESNAIRDFQSIEAMGRQCYKAQPPPSPPHTYDFEKCDSNYHYIRHAFNFFLIFGPK